LNSAIVRARSLAMHGLAYALAGITLATAIFVWPIPWIARATSRPRFVVALVLAAIAVALYDAGTAAFASQDYERLWLGQRIGGAPARLVALANVALCGVAAWGLWRMRPWARVLAMLYLGYVIGSFLIWGLGGSGGEDLASIMLWQMFVLPLLVFGLMYLQRGGKYFRPPARE
jgi:hypothetical protein